MIGFHWQTLSQWISHGAAYDSAERSPAPRCHPRTRTEILNKIDEWVKPPVKGGTKSFLWLHGPAGAGKSAIAQTVAETCADRGQLAASFFFSRSSPDRNALKYLFPTIIFQISMSSHSKRQKLQEILRDDPGIAYRTSGSINLLVSLFRDPPGALHDDSTIPASPFLVIIDGLDECRGNKDQSSILSDVHDLVHKHCLPLRFLIVSRPESHIRETLDKSAMSSITEVLSVYGDFGARDDVKTYLRDEFRRIQDSEMHQDIMQFVPKPWPSDSVIEQIVEKSGGYFIYAATVIKYVDEEYFSCLDRLDEALGSSTAQHDPEETPFAELDRLYSSVLSTCPKSQLPHLKRALAIIGDRPRVSAMEVFFDLRPGQLKLTLRGLRSIVAVSDGADEGRLYSFHASFLDFLFDPARAKDYYVDREQCYVSNFHRLFSLVSQSIRAPGAQNRLESFVVT